MKAASQESIALGADVRRRREAQGLSLGELGKRSGVSMNYIGQVELGARDPSLSIVLGLARGLGVEPGDLFPCEGLSPAAAEAGHLIDALDPVQRKAVIALLRTVDRSPARPAKRPRRQREQ